MNPFQAIQGSSIALLPFIAAGYPSLDATLASVRAIDTLAATHRIGAIEIGFPFSDPIADGPVIQEAYNVALEQGVTSQKIFAALKTLPKPTTPLLAMVSHSIVYRYGSEKFFADAQACGFSGILIPDLPPPEAQVICEQIARAGLASVLLVAPTTSDARRKLIGQLSTGFVYYLAVSGITGERKELPADIHDKLKALREVINVPLCVGFGVSSNEHVKQLATMCDGAIVGSAIVRLMREHAKDSPEAIAKKVAEFCRGLLTGSV
jgi:tryptophan synthase alpha chain